MKRMWINQPSSLQKFNSLHGVRVLAIQETDIIARVYFLSGDIISQQLPLNILSEGWPDE